ncbi:ABC transporter substrate-binding protein [Variovorax sp. KK3]|uniref:ABC transporter substrate-binding protein n=1 Tax=Variovorax sp. KK3 TaxID=1855728 RepID=UPI0009FB1A00|nr:ABC transporter substrate-binding protein [Variovorax sp. KK3]
MAAIFISILRSAFIRTLCATGLLALACTAAWGQILVGQTTGVTGPAAASVNETIAGAQLLFDAVNATGGIHGEQIKLVRLDDGFDAQRAGENARELIEQTNVVALFQNYGTPQTQAIIPWLDKHGVALIGPSAGAQLLQQPAQRHVFQVRSSYQLEAEKAVAHLLSVGVIRIAVVHVADAFGQDALDGAMTGFRKAMTAPVLVLPAHRDEPDHAAIVPKITASQAEAVLWIGSSAGVASGIRALRAAGSTAQVVTLSNNASAGFIKQLGDASRGVIVTQVFPNERSIAQPMVKEALDLARTKGQYELSPAALEGFASAKVLVEALRRAGPRPTRAKVVAALRSMQPYDLGGGLLVSYAPQAHAGIEFAELSIISGGQFRR